MISISLCMIIKNEEDTLARCLATVEGIADEIIIVDTGSQDRSKEVAARFTDKIYDFEWCDDFSAARNFSFAQASMDYILWLDADDILLPEDIIKFQILRQTLSPDIDAVMMKYNTGFDAEGQVTFSYYRERLCKRGHNYCWREPVHEYLEISGKRINADICITHAKPPGRGAGGRNMGIYEQLLAAGKELSPRGMYYYARELKDNRRYSEAIKWFESFLASGRGWLEDNISSCGELAHCHLAENQPENALAALFKSFAYDNPRAEICCQIGYYFKEQGNFRQAAFWFNLVLSLEKNAESWGFCQEDCWGYIPCVELAVCYDRLREYEKASRMNERAGVYKPNSPAVLRNKEYFTQILAAKQT